MKSVRISRLRVASLAAVLAVLASSLQAGTIVGRTADAKNGTALPGVSVQLEDGISAISDAHGEFRIPDVPAGAHKLSGTTVGYNDASTTIEVPAQGDVTVDLPFTGEVQVLSAMVVEGYREGRSRALQEKRTAVNVMDVISADAIGNLPDRNVAEAVSRLPGVNLSLDQGEGRYVSIRGVEPNLNQVLLDGATMAAPGGTRLGRAVPLDTLGAGQISSIEVIKSVTPDLDANSLGGTINIKTASAFDRKSLFVAGSIGAQQEEATGKTNPVLRFNFSDVFGSKLGIAANLSYDKRDYSNEWVQVGGWDQRTINGSSVWLPNDFEVKPEWGWKRREGVDFNIEYRPDADTEFFVRPNFSTTRKYENTFEIINSTSTGVSDVTFSSPLVGVFKGKNRTERREFRNLTDQDLMNIAGGFNKHMGAFTLETMLTYSGAKEKHDYDDSFQFRNGNGNTGPIAFDINDFVPKTWVEDYTVDVPSKYSLRRTRADFGIIDENTSTAKADLVWKADDSAFGHNTSVKVGGKATRRKRVTDLESRRLVPVGSWNLGQIGVKDGVPVYDGQYNSGFLLDWQKTNDFIAANPALVTPSTVEQIQNSIEDDYNIAEYIYAGYLMGTTSFKNLTLLGGIRWERTNATIRAVEARFSGKDFVGEFPTSGVFNYDSFFPNIQAVYHFTKRLQLRAAFTQTIGRPAYEDARPLATFQYDTLGDAAANPAYPYSGSLSVGNPQLKPYRSNNFDLSLEWYVKYDGVISLGLFRKDISDPIYSYSERQVDVVHSGIPLETLTVTGKFNGDSGRISGAEFNIYQPFRFLPSPFDGFGIDANLTRITSSEDIPQRPGENIPFFRQPDKISNVTLFYEKYNASARVAWSYAGEQIYTLGSGILNDVYLRPRQQVDVQVRYRFSPHYSATAAVRNLTREPEQYSYGVKNLLRTSRLLGQVYQVSFDFNF